MHPEVSNHEKHETHEREGSEIIYRSESYAIMGACFEVYKEMGSGFLESVYQECLKQEFVMRNILYEEKPSLLIVYKGQSLEQRYQPDFICCGKIVLELKAVRNISDEHRAQIINYLRVTGLRLGILVNFGHYPKVEYERFAV